MQRLPQNKLLEFHPKTLQAVRKMYGYQNAEDMRNAINILDNWVKEQKHFVKRDFSEHFLEFTIISCKGSIERAKQRLDKLCTLKTLLPQYFGNWNAKKDFANVDDKMCLLILPQLTKDHYRIFLVKLWGNSFDRDTTWIQFARIQNMFSEYFKSHDYAAGVLVLVDVREIDMRDYIASLNLVQIRQSASILIEGYGVRLKGIHYLSESKMATTAVAIFKQVINSKLGNRIYGHNSIHTVYDYIDKDLLPIEYGGKQKSTQVLNAEWKDELSSEEFLAHQRDMLNARTNESVRPVDQFNEQYMGTPGTFRTLTVD